jgi:serine/threonine protein kinase
MQTVSNIYIFQLIIIKINLEIKKKIKMNNSKFENSKSDDVFFYDLSKNDEEGPEHEENNKNIDESDSSKITQDQTYVFVKFLGRGSFGTVNLYRNSTDNSLVVWKQIELNRLDIKSRNEAFSEVEILSMLDHPNIIGYYTHFVGNDDHTLYIELEYAKGGNLASIISHYINQSSHFEEETILWYFYQLCNAVEYIHSNGIMHRDIKALNIFFMQSGLLKLGDFGIAKVLDPQIGLAQSVNDSLFFIFFRLLLKLIN